jgi:class 3 adenylate cyclase
VASEHGQRKIAAILVADVVGYSRLTGADEDRTLSRLRGLRSDLIDPAIAAHRGRVVKRTGDGSLVEFADLFKLQDQVVARLGNTLGFELVRAEANKGGRSASPDAIDLTMRGWAVLWQGIQQQSMTEKQAIYYAARPLFEQALAIDPNYPTHWRATR